MLHSFQARTKWRLVSCSGLHVLSWDSSYRCSLAPWSYQAQIDTVTDCLLSLLPLENEQQIGCSKSSCTNLKHTRTSQEYQSKMVWANCFGRAVWANCCFGRVWANLDPKRLERTILILHCNGLNSYFLKSRQPRCHPCSSWSYVCFCDLWMFGERR